MFHLNEVIFLVLACIFLLILQKYFEIKERKRLHSLLSEANARIEKLENQLNPIQAKQDLDLDL